MDSVSLDSGNKTDVKSFSIFPNPSSNSFMLKGTDLNNVQLQVSDLTGRIVEEFNLAKFKNSKYEFGGELAEGIYAASVISDNNKKIIKIVKTK
jgi:hypothetical protein